MVGGEYSESRTGVMAVVTTSDAGGDRLERA